MSLAWWLFVREAGSIRVDVTSPLTLAVRGPGTLRRVHGFAREVDLAEFAIALEHRLRADGWTMNFQLERRVGGERRRQPRVTPDRRQPLPPSIS
jgi:hypothetical protein